MSEEIEKLVGMLEGKIHLCSVAVGATLVDFQYGEKRIVFALDDIGREHIVRLLNKIDEKNPMVTLTIESEK